MAEFQNFESHEFGLEFGHELSRTYLQSSNNEKLSFKSETYISAEYHRKN